MSKYLNKLKGENISLKENPFVSESIKLEISSFLKFNKNIKMRHTNNTNKKGGIKKMKKILNTILILSILFTFILSLNSNSVQAVALDDIEISTNKDTVNPGDTVTLTIKFGKPLGAYTFDIAYDNDLLEYVETDGGTPNDNGTRVRVVFYDSTGGTNPKESMSITFKAKEGIITSNPTDLAVTAVES